MNKIMVVACFSIIALFSSWVESSAVTGETAPRATTLMTVAGLFKVSYKTEPAPIPLNSFHTWILKIQTADGKPVTDAEIGVSGGMPAHGHGLQSTPKVMKDLGNSEYRIEGVKFFMPGLWVMTFTIKSEGKEDKVTFIVEL